MNRHFKVLVISIINGVFIFLLFMRYWRLERSEILSANHFVSVALVTKIICNLLTDNGKLNADCFWNTSVLIFYAVFMYTADHHEFVKRYFKPTTLSSLTRYSFRHNSAILQNIDYVWSDPKLIVSCVLLAVVMYNPFVTNSIKTCDCLSGDYAELIRKYKHLLKMKRIKQMKKVFKAEKSIEYIPKQSKPNPDICNKSKVIEFQHDGKQRRGLIIRDNDGLTEESSKYIQMSLLQRGDGAGDKKCSPTTISYCDQKTITTQTILSEESHASTGIQCKIVSSIRKSGKTFTMRPVGSSIEYVCSGSDKSTNTYPSCKKRSKPKFVTLKEDHRSKHHKTTPTKGQELIIEAQKSIMLYNNLRKQIQTHLNPRKKPQIPVDICNYKQKANDIFKLDDLMQSTDAWYRRKGITKGLDVFPTKDQPGDEMNSLNVLYYADKTVNSAEATNHSDLRLDVPSYQ